MLSKTKFSFDIEKLVPLLSDVQWDSKNRCQLNYPTGNWLYDPYEIKDTWKGSLFEDILEQLSQEYPVGEARLIKLLPGSCYPSHTDVDDRLHINLVGNEQSYLIDLDTHSMYKTDKDNNVYHMDASHKHVAANFGSSDRIQLVIRIRLSRVQDEKFSRRTIKFHSVYESFRYDFDNTISQVISRYIKQKKIGFFDVVNDREIIIESDQEIFNDIVERIRVINKDFETI